MPHLRAWVLTRTAALGLGALAIVLHRGNVFLDAKSYAGWARAAMNGHRVPYRDFAWEYPPAALPAMVVPHAAIPVLRWIGIAGTYAYTILWVAFMVSVDAAVAFRALPRWVEQRTAPAHTVWFYGLPLLGALTWARYDLLPAAAALAAVVASARAGSIRSGHLAGIGGALKIWPAVLAPVQRTRREALHATGIMSVVLVGVGVLTYGVTGHTGYGSVLRYQSRRGLQVESIAALPLVWLAHLHVAGYRARFRFGAWEVLGPGERSLAMAATALLVLGLLALGWVHWRFMHVDAGTQGVALTAVSVVLLVLVTDKVFSPQYLLWLVAILAAACVLEPEAWRPYVPAALVTCGVTAAEFPWFYGDVLGRGWFGLIVLSLRDAVVLGMAAFVTRRLRTQLRARPPDELSTVHTQAPLRGSAPG